VNFADNLFVMLVDHVLMVLFDNGCLFVGLDNGLVLMCDDFNLREFLSHFCWFNVLYDNCLFISSMDNWSMCDLLTGAGVILLIAFDA